MHTQEQLDRVTAAAAAFTRYHDRKPVLLFDADGVIYKWEEAYVAHYHAAYPHMTPVTEPFDDFDTTKGRPPLEAAALLQSIDDMDYSTIALYDGAQEILPLLLQAGCDVAIVTAHTTANVYCASAKVLRIHEDFDGVFDKRLVITQDKTRVFGDWLVDDKPEITGLSDTPTDWEQIFFTQRYNEGSHGLHVTWETMLDGLAAVIEDKTGTDRDGQDPVGDASDVEHPAEDALSAEEGDEQ